MPSSNARQIHLLSDASEVLDSNHQLQTLRDKGIVAYKNAVLYVAEAYAADAGVASFEVYCKRHRIKINKELVSVEVINRINSTFVKTDSDSKNSQAKQTFHEITTAAVSANASDIHIIIKGKSTTIKYRVNGDLMVMASSSLTREDGELLCSAIYTSLTDAADTTYTPSQQQDGRVPSKELHSSIREKVSGIRIATTPIQGDHGDVGSLMALRLLYDTGIGTLDDLGYKPEQIATIENMTRHSTGINIVVGPTGSGKSTTLKTVLTQLERDYDGRIHILTIEDPPEQTMPGINQIPVTNVDSAEDRSKAFNAVVRGSMRLDPDCIMIGEVRDAATAMLALNASMTGHRVWTTLHANTALGAIPRLATLDVDLALLTEPSIFRGVFSQRLVKQLCPHCRIPYQKAGEYPVLSQYLQRSGLAERMKAIVKGHSENIFFKGEGCDYCDNSNPGTKGRTVVVEIFENTYGNKTMDLMLEKKWPQARAAWLESGGTTMMMHAIEKIQQGILDPRAVEDVLDPIYVEKV
ncbi:MAG: ATPase, T2SS/T4P/T4SS family [Methylobacter sp.]